MGVLTRNNVLVSGAPDGRPMVFAHGFGCDQHMWRGIEPDFRPQYRTVLFDHVGAGRSDLTAYNRARYDSLHGYADDVVEICTALDLHDAVFVGHSVSAMIGVLAAIRATERIGALVLIGPSPRYIDDQAGGYVGGFSKEDIVGLLDALDSNYLGWSSSMARVIMGRPDRPELAAELEESFCRTDPIIAGHFAEVTFLSDNRRDLPQVSVPTLVVQASQDAIAAPAVGRYVHRHISGSDYVVLEATGHCPHLSAPDETIAAMRDFLDRT
jgi:sigma-B regulation protein RsbQ